MPESDSPPPQCCTEPDRLEGNSVVAIDPGSAKCGIAVVNLNLATLFRSIVLTSNLPSELVHAIATYRPRVIIVGNGTGSKQVVDSIRNALAEPLTILNVEEAYTSEEARKRYLQEVKPRGFQRLLPPSLRTPALPYDDYVAVILGERYWQTLLAANCVRNKSS